MRQRRNACRCLYVSAHINVSICVSAWQQVMCLLIYVSIYVSAQISDETEKKRTQVFVCVCVCMNVRVSEYLERLFAVYQAHKKHACRCAFVRVYVCMSEWVSRTSACHLWGREETHAGVHLCVYMCVWVSEYLEDVVATHGTEHKCSQMHMCMRVYVCVNEQKWLQMWINMSVDARAHIYRRGHTYAQISWCWRSFKHIYIHTGNRGHTHISSSSRKEHHGQAAGSPWCKIRTHAGMYGHVFNTCVSLFVRLCVCMCIYDGILNLRWGSVWLCSHKVSLCICGGLLIKLALEQCMVCVRKVRPHAGMCVSVCVHKVRPHAGMYAYMLNICVCIYINTYICVFTKLGRAQVCYA